MIIPKGLKIGGHNITINIRELDSSDDSGMRQMRKNKDVIVIDTDLPRSQQEATLLHEIFHVINIELDEKEVEFLAQAFYQIIADNPPFLK